MFIFILPRKLAMGSSPTFSASPKVTVTTSGRLAGIINIYYI